MVSELQAFTAPVPDLSGHTDIHLDEIIKALIKAATMNLLDIIIITVMVFFAFRGLIRGIFMEIASLAGVILGFLIGLRFHPMITNLLKPRLPSFDELVLQLISFAVIFTCVLILCNFSGWMIKVILKKTSLGWADKGLGATLAAIKGILIIYLAIVILTFFVPSKAPLVTGSKLAPLIISSYQSMISVLSPDFYRGWKNRFMEQKDKIGNVVSKKIEDFTE